MWLSLRNLGLRSLRELKDGDRWCRVTTVATGRVYNSNGVTKEATTFVFLNLYATETECEAAFRASRNGDGDDWIDAPAAATPANGAQSTNGTAHAEQRERETALAFARILAKQATSVPELAARLAEYPLVSRFAAGGTRRLGWSPCRACFARADAGGAAPASRARAHQRRGRAFS